MCYAHEQVSKGEAQMFGNRRRNKLLDPVWGLATVLGGGGLALPITTGLTADFDSRFGLYQDSIGLTPATAENDPVGLWRDNSGNGRDVSQGTGSLRLTLRRNSIGGFPGLQALNGDYLSGLATSAYITQSTYTIYTVLKVAGVGTNVTTPGSIYTNDSIWAVGGGYGGLVMTSGTPDFRLYNYTPPEVEAVKPFVLSTWYAAYCQHAAGNIYFGLGNSAEVSTPSADTGVISGAFFVGGPAAGAASDHTIARMIVYNVAHTPTQKAVIMNYLNALYGVAL